MHEIPEQLVAKLKKEINDVDDVKLNMIATEEGDVTLIYFSSLIEKMTLQSMVSIPLTNNIKQIHQMAQYVDPKDIQGVIKKLNSGQTLLFFHETNALLSMDTYSAPTRAITNTETESTVIGPQDAFTESLETNISLVRRRIQSAQLKNENRIVGSEANIKISIMYMDNIVNHKNLDDLRNRIDQVEFPLFTDISVLKQLIEDNPLSPFPQYYMTVRPDSICRYLIDGRIVMFMDNSQLAIVCPTSFFEMFVSIEDYYNRWTTASLLRMLRFFGFFLTIMITPMYISALTFHPEILPYELLLNLQESRSKVPFPPLIEVLFIELIVEVLREAGSRMPAKVGQTIGIVGGIVIGTAAVQAGLLSNILIVLVATSALLSFLPPIFLMSNASRFVRYIFILSAGLFGLFGQMLAFAWLIHHLLSLKSLGTHYMTPGIPRNPTDLLDNVIRFPINYLTKKSGISSAQKKPTEEK
ncbi:spore germination protein [Lysinibacillus sp. FSL M8-0216]|uniref:GerA spore germination protein n=1 Tax=Lysinibacillus fusiformis TaxID=28031 RepID=A0A1H9N7P2_9BACI|nr:MULTISPECIES: spore germination protein [Lysinibacillus]MED4671355.1 spore germination protein [Lysinibacillus fusiformis]QAS55190.1 spore germination protein [Lysinibacillus sphaericus]RDV33409.1 spore germination protein [Lysinibacillus fusiformis]SCX39526.1 GerA spore germination protein [Lysinibacillus fusiformis]SCY63660.1 GerA spore germination protein [Lysinibacillus fusiformis]